MSPAWTLVTGWLVVSGLAGFIMMGIDKSRAVEGTWRIREETLFDLAIVGGTFGIFIGAGAFHHKTRKQSFMGVVLLTTVLWVAVLAVLAYYIGPPLG